MKRAFFWRLGWRLAGILLTKNGTHNPFELLPMKTVLLVLTICMIGVCLNVRTNHFHPKVTESRLMALARPDLRGWPDFALLFLILLVLACLCVSPFFTNNHRK